MIRKLPIAGLCLLVFCLSISSQIRVVGKVVKVLDGRTVEVAGSSLPIRAQLYGIEIPNDDHPLAEVLTEHLKQLTADCEVEVIVFGDVSSVSCKGVNLSMQVVRDGAAWVWSDGFSTTTRGDSYEFEALEALARNEKRGVWAEPNLIRPSRMEALVRRSLNPLEDPEVSSAARSSLGPSVEGVFGPEIYSLSGGSCSGKVVGVVDGDTVKILTNQNQQITVRLAGIDAPEKAQAYGQAAKQKLSDLVFGKTVDCESGKTDRYGRTVGKLTLNGQNVNLAMISGCYAWHYKEYQHEQSVSDRSAYASAENSAKTAGCGLWKDNPINPAEFRRNRFLAYYASVDDSGYANGIYVGGFSGGGTSGDGSRGSGGPVHVRSYTRSNGTVVRSHTRSAPRRN